MGKIGLDWKTICVLTYMIQEVDCDEVNWIRLGLGSNSGLL